MNKNRKNIVYICDHAQTPEKDLYFRLKNNIIKSQ